MVLLVWQRSTLLVALLQFPLLSSHLLMLLEPSLVQSQQSQLCQDKAA
jgi:hypothetical protein